MITNVLRIAIVIMLVVVFNACEDQSVTPSEASPISTSGSSMQPTPIFTPETSAAPMPTPNAAKEGFSIRSKLKELSFGQFNPNWGSMSDSWTEAEIPNNSFQLPYYMEEVSISASFAGLNEKEQQEVIGQIQVKGKVKWEVQPNPYYSEGLMIRFNKPTESFVLHLGDLPAITFIQKEPISYTLTSNTEREVPHLLLKAREYGTKLVIPIEEKNVVLAFSEEMQLNLPTTNEGKEVEAEWLDSKHLRIQMNNMSTGTDEKKELYLNTAMLKSQSGNYLGLDGGGIVIQQIPRFEWYDAQSGDQVGLSPRDRFYDQMVWSTDKQSYVGIFYHGGSLGDGDGSSYSFVLERAGKEPVIIEDVFYSTIAPGDLPIEWMDANTLLYSSYYGAFAYDIDKGSKRLLHGNGVDEKNNLNFAVYDSTRKSLHILAYGNRSEYGQLDLITYEQARQIPKQITNYTSTVNSNRYSALNMTITPTLEGTYWTRIKNGIPYTDFVNNAGERVTTEGYVRLVSDEGVYLERFTKWEQQIKSSSWAIWQPGKTARTIAMLPESNRIFVSGQNLITLKDTVYYQFNQASQKWVLWKAANGERNAEPIRGVNGLYRVWIDK